MAEATRGRTAIPTPLRRLPEFSSAMRPNGDAHLRPNRKEVLRRSPRMRTTFVNKQVAVLVLRADVLQLINETRTKFIGPIVKPNRSTTTLSFAQSNIAVRT